MIALEAAHARTGGDRGQIASVVKDVTVTWERGILALLGTPADGTTALLEVVAGLTRVRGGRVLVDGRPPSEVRARVAYVPLKTSLPEALRVDELCELAGRIRGEPAQTPASRLGVLGIEALANRRVRSLSPGESRAVSLALALSSKATVILVEEPLAGLDPSAPARIIEALRARGADGAAVIITTASVRDATRLADQLGILTKGIFSHLAPSLAHVDRAGAKLRVVVAATRASEVSPFVAALSEQSAVSSVEIATFAGSPMLHAAIAVVVSGRDLLPLARAVGAAAVRARANVLAIESAVMPLDAIRAAMAVPRPGILMAPPSPAPSGQTS